MSIYVRDTNGNRQKIAGVGLPGPAGKSAYQYAVEGGFSGTEEEFRAVVGIRNNDNLLDNWYLADPINQRGQKEYTGARYTIDRWKLWSADGQLSIADDGILLSEGKWLFQPMESKEIRADIAYTLSVLSTNGVSYISVYVDNNHDYVFEGTGPLSSGSFTISPDANISIPRVSICGKANSEIIAVKLELGPVQTLAHKDASGTWVLNDPPPDPALELAKCQRYYRRFDRIVANTGGISTAYISPYLTYPDMRATPLFLCHGGIVDGGGLPINASIVRAEFTKNSGVIIQLNESFSGSGVVQFLDCSLSSDL